MQTFSRFNPIKLINKNKIDLLDTTGSYNVERYPWAYLAWKLQQQVHWLPEEVPMSEDIRDWNIKLTSQEKNFLTQIFRLFTQSDIEVADNYMLHYMQVFQPLEVKMMLSAFANIETVHLEAYALLLKTLGIDSSEFSAFRNYRQMSEKIDYLHEFNIRTCADVTRTLAMFGAFTEGLSLFASFAMLLNFPRNNKMKGMGQIISWSVRDESLHCEAMINLFHEWTRQTGTATKQIKQQIREIASWQVFLEDQFIDLAFQEGDFESLTKADIKEYIRYIAGWRLTQLKIKPMFGYFEEDKAGSYRQIKSHPLPWLLEILNGVEHANFFETRSTEYSKVATEGSWHGDDGVWTNFDAYNQRKSSAVQEV